MNLLIVLLLFSCGGYNKQDMNIDKLVFIDKNLKSEISVEIGTLNYKVFYKNENLLNAKVKIDSSQMEKYKDFVVAVSSDITIDSTNIYLEGINEIYYLSNNEHLRGRFTNFDRSIKLGEQLNDAIFVKVNTLIANEDYNKAFKVAEMSVYLRQPFYYGSRKDDRSLKIMAQKTLFEQGEKQEAINNLLKM